MTDTDRLREAYEWLKGLRQASGDHYDRLRRINANPQTVADAGGQHSAYAHATMKVFRLLHPENPEKEGTPK